MESLGSWWCSTFERWIPTPPLDASDHEYSPDMITWKGLGYGATPHTPRRGAASVSVRRKVGTVCHELPVVMTEGVMVNKMRRMKQGYRITEDGVSMSLLKNFLALKRDP